MHLNRLIFLSIVFIGLSATADAQYTNRTGTSSGYTSRTAPTRPTQGYGQQARPTQGYGQQARPTQGYGQQARPTTGATTQNKQASSYVNNPARAQAAASQAQPTFRPRQPVTADAEDDELPSFDRLEGKKAGNNAEGANGTEEEAVPPPPPPKGQIWIYLTNFKDEGGHSRYCHWEIVVQNRTDTDLEVLNINYKLGNAFSDIAVKNLAAGASVIDKNGIYNSKCPEMKNAKPADLNAVKCKFGSISGKECNSYFVVK